MLYVILLEIKILSGKGKNTMALGDIQWLQWKTKKTQAKDEEEYAQWAFPYGDEQKEKITALLNELIPDETKEIAMICFLTAKEIVNRYNKIYYIPEHHEYALECMNKDFVKYKRLFRSKNHIKLCCALAFVDVDMKDTLEYPDAESIRKLGDEIGQELIKISGR